MPSIKQREKLRERFEFVQYVRTFRNMSPIEKWQEVFTAILLALTVFMVCFLCHYGLQSAVYVNLGQ
jgi:hypothetical protein